MIGQERIGVQTLYLIATPIGNLQDISLRALHILQQLDIVYAEDTRRTRQLLHAHNLTAIRIYSCHQHNEAQQSVAIVKCLQQGKSLALVSDAGTPLISDPGMRVVRAVRAAGLSVVAIPGPCAALVALTASGMSTDTGFTFLGFPPATSRARLQFLMRYAQHRLPLVFFASPHRLIMTLMDMAACFGKSRMACLARELTKIHENYACDTLERLLDRCREQTSRGEYTLVVSAYQPTSNDGCLNAEEQRIYRLIAEELPPRRAVALAAQICARPKRDFYQLRIAEHQQH